MAAFTKLQTRMTPTKRFAILSLVVIGLIAISLSLVISYYLRKDLLDREWGVTADYIRAEAAYHLTPSDFDAPWSRAAQEHFRAFYEQIVMMPEIDRIKIWDRTTAVIFSDENRLIGRRFPDNLQLTEAIGGRTTVNIVERKKSEHVYEAGDFPLLVEVYVPIVLPGSSRVAGVIETYKVPKQVLANIRKGQITVAVTALAGMLLLYLTLFWIFRGATSQIEGQHQALQHRSLELGLANHELVTTQAQLVEAERMAAIGEVVTAVAHGIRNPLANIRASAQAAMLDCGDCQQSALGPRNLTITMAEVDRLDARLKELLNFIRPAERKTGPVDLNLMLHRTLQTMAGRIANADFKVEEKLAPVLPPIMGNPMLIEQVLVSLIDNAIEAMPGGSGTITLVTGTEPDNEAGLRVFAEVRDTGVGIREEEIPKILESFYTTKAQGTGLGLAIAKKFTEAYSGALSVWSRPGEGTIFRVTFPAQQEV